MRGAALNCWLAVNGIQKADMSEVLMSLTVSWSPHP
jgi:hypothetical protein